MELFNLGIKTIFIENMIFAYFLGMCSYLAVSKKVATANGLGVAVTFVLMVTVPLCWALQVFLLKSGSLAWLGESFASIDLEFLQFILFIAVIAAVVQLVEMIVEKVSPALYGALGIFLPLIAVNCAVLGACLFMVQRGYTDDASWGNFAKTLVFAFGSGLGWWLAITSLAAIRERLKYSNIPAPLRGLGITMLLTGLMGMAFMSFMGIKI